MVYPFEFLGFCGEFKPVSIGVFAIHLLDEFIGRYAHFFGYWCGEFVPPSFGIFVGFLLLGEVHGAEHEAGAELVVEDDGIWVGVGFLGEGGDGGCHGGGE